ncbi:hypothetical protein A6R74_07975 [Halomonas sp. ALS9]|nr:hypothetical protein A6R74_07975 [Halomonas sp. ALS9]
MLSGITSLKAACLAVDSSPVSMWVKGTGLLVDGGDPFHLGLDQALLVLLAQSGELSAGLLTKVAP